MKKDPKPSSDAGEADNAATEEDAEELTSEEWLEFDTRSWADFTALYKSHQNLVDAINAYSSGRGSDVSFYDYCSRWKSILEKPPCSSGTVKTKSSVIIYGFCNPWRFLISRLQNIS